MVLVEQPEVAPPCFAVFASDLLARRFPKYGCVLVVEVGVIGVPYATAIAEVLLTASVSDLIPKGWLGGQPVKQTLPVVEKQPNF